jgi:hypothetical protein
MLVKVYLSEHELREAILSDGESNPGLPRFVLWQAEIMTVRPSKMIIAYEFNSRANVVVEVANDKK